EAPATAVRAGVAQVLAYGGQFASNSVPALLGAAQDQESTVRTAAIESLATIALRSNVVAIWRFQAGREVLRNGTESASWSVVDIIPALQATQPAAVTLLAGALHHKSERVRAHAARTLAAMGPAA